MFGGAIQAFESKVLPYAEGAFVALVTVLDLQEGWLRYATSGVEVAAVA